MTPERIAEMLAAMLGREPTDEEITNAVRGYEDGIEQWGELHAKLPEDRFFAALDAEVKDIVHELQYGPRKPF